jgi:hypothetical protein
MILPAAQAAAAAIKSRANALLFSLKIKRLCYNKMKVVDKQL